MAYKNVLLQALPEQWTGKLMGHMVELDEAVDSLGKLRLSTIQRFTRHMGNALSPELVQEARQLGLQTAEASSTTARRPARKHWLLRLPGGRRLLMAAYKRLFDILYR